MGLGAQDPIRNALRDLVRDWSQMENYRLALAAAREYEGR